MFEWVWTISPVVWFALALSLGALLIAIGWRGRRIGDEPRCRRCAYILDDLPTSICPECGLDSKKRRPKRGLRKIRAVPLIAGVPVLLFAISPALWIWQNADWRSQAPGALLMIAMDFGDAAARTELTARLIAGDATSEPRLRRTISRALAAHAHAPVDSSRMKNWLTLLGELDDRDLLNDEEWQRMVRQCVRGFRCRVRDRCREDIPLPIELTAEIVLPPNAAIAWTARLSPELGRRAADPPAATVLVPYVPPVSQEVEKWTRFTGEIRHGFRSGAHTIELAIEGRYFAFDISGYFDIPAIRSHRPSDRAVLRATRVPPSRFNTRAITLGRVTRGMVDPATLERDPPDYSHACETKVTIVASSADDDLIPVSGDPARSRAVAGVTIDIVSADDATHLLDDNHIIYRAPRIRLTRPLPFALAYEIIAEYCGSRQSMGYIWIPEGTPFTERTLYDVRFAEMRDAPITLVLKPAPQILRKTCDIRYLDETLVLGPIDLSDKAEEAR